MIGVRFLLLATKGFLSLWQSLKRIPIIASTVKQVGRFFYLASLHTLTPVYRIYRRIKRAVKRWLDGEKLTWLKPFSHRYILHSLTALITLVTLYSNLATPSINTEGYGKGRLIVEVVGTDDYESELANLPALPDYILNDLKADAEEQDATPRSFVSMGGEAIYQPYLPTIESSVARRTKAEKYVVQNGDTLGGIASRFQIQLTTLLYSNGLTSRSLIQPGQSLVILPLDGLTHKIAKNETITSIANKYGVKGSDILAFNGIDDPSRVQVGQELVIPGGKPPATVPKTVAKKPTSKTPTKIPAAATNDEGLTLLWPTTDHHINQYYGYRHTGLDIRGKIGHPIYASEDGVVLESRWAGSYGKMVLIKHDNGLITRYAHHERNLVEVGERVTRGQTIALMGSTGRSTGPHLHYEVIADGTRVNPLSYTR